MTTGTGQVLRIVLQVVSVVVLARLLTPTDYGLVAMVTAVIGIGEILREMGLSTAAIQASTLSRAQRDNLFWLNTGAGGAMALLVIATAPLFELLYGRDELLAIALALSPTFFLSGLSAQYRADLTRGLRFGALTVIELVAAGLALSVGIGLAAQGFGYWSLVIQQLAGGLFALLLLASTCRWVPHGYDRGAEMGSLVRFGSRILGSQVLTYTSVNIDSMLIGSVFGARDLGFYNRGMQLVRTPLNQLRAPVGTVALPIMSRLQGDPQRLMLFVSRAQVAVGLPILTGIGWFIACGEPVVRLLLGEQWVPATPIIQLIAAGEGLSTLMFMASWMYVSLGLGNALVRFSLFTLALRVVLLLAALPFGIVAVAAVGVLGPAIVLPIALAQVGRAAGINTTRLLFQACGLIALVAFASIVAALTARAVPGLDSLGLLAMTAAVQLSILAASTVLKPVRRQFLSMMALLTLLRQDRVND